MKKLITICMILSGILFSFPIFAQVNKNKPVNKESTSDKKPGTVTTNTKGATATKLFDAAGTLIFTHDQMGYVRNARNRVFFQYTAAGDIVKKRAVIGSVKNGIFRDRLGKEYARIVQDGKVVDANSKPVGTSKTDGTVLDKNGTKIGSAPGVNVNVAVMVFFYRDVLENTKVKGSIR
ncbi:MAG: hypothetical protein RBS55_12470 [Bacteroidales bacterium]|jgi:hypothetical protein|nr:hypothetical protein [Bacteroidales bacterium]